MEKIINKLIEAVSQLKKKNTVLADQITHSTSIASKAVKLATVVKQQNNEIKNLSRQNKNLETKVSTLKTIKHEYPKEVKVSNFPADKKVQEVKIINKEVEKPKWLPELFADFFKVFTTVQTKIASTTTEQLIEFFSKLWRGGISVSFKGPQPFYIVDEHGMKIRTKELLSSMGGGGNTVIYRGGGGTSTSSAINGPGAPIINSYDKVAINLAAGTNQELIAAPGAGKQIWVYGITYVLSVAGTVAFEDSDGTATTGIMPHAGNSGLSTPPSGNFSMPIWKIATNKALRVDVVTAEIDGWIDYAIVSV